MRDFFEKLLVMLGKAPKRYKTSEKTEKAIEIYQKPKQLTSEEIKKLKIELENAKSGRYRKKWRNRRWAVLITINLLFTLSFWLDIQLFEGSMIASRVVGIHMADVYSALQIILAYQLFTNLFVGMITVTGFWMIFGGRAFCSWVCPYHFLAELTEKIHIKLVAKKIVTDHPFHRAVRPVFWVVFALIAFFSGYAVFNSINPVGIVSRMLIYGL